jgi:soluble lytic murein transglycosylase-like protein
MRRAARVCAALAVLLWLGSAHGGTLYRCTGTSGEAVFSSTSVGYRNCRRVASFASPPRVAATRNKSVGGSVKAGDAAKVVSDAPHDAAATIHTNIAPASDESSKPGRWSYAESAGPLATTGQPDAPQGGSRVLRGAVYRVVHRDGSVEYTNMHPAGAVRAVTMLFSYIATCMACNLHSTIDWNHTRLDLASYADVVRLASSEFGVDEAFLRAVIHAESAFNPRALSLKGAQGLMQLMPGTAGDMGVADAFDPAQNIRGGARYLAVLLKDFKGDERLAAAAYNAGAAAVQRYKGIPPFAETQVYVQRVGALRKRYGDALPRPMIAAGGSL